MRMSFEAFMIIKNHSEVFNNVGMPLLLGQGQHLFTLLKG